eukprot:CAMPEP_0194266256 /NCGR_PEP_ID=MMETSP0169-20130528/1220_1 /TAXON_ID=218684 /ORGANISM="Corethron pennatum, Strain L29A3" /LENGTH=627 /DNA_ID=CAMNT_0039006899 /DNA_START=497 /DNA_END=2384 /DNA_ORIENTATION=-
MDVLPSRSFQSFDKQLVANRSTDDLERLSRGFKKFGEKSPSKRPERPKSQPQYEKRRPRFAYLNSKNDLQIPKSRKGTEFPSRVGCMSSSVQSQKPTLNYSGSVRSRNSTSSRRTSPNKLRVSPLNSAYSFCAQKSFSKPKSKHFQMVSNISTQKSVSDFNDVAGIASLLKSDSTSICSQKSGLPVSEYNLEQSYCVGNRSSGSFSAPKLDSVKPQVSDFKAHTPRELESNSVNSLLSARLIGTNQEDFSEHCSGPFVPNDRHKGNNLLVSTHSTAASAYSNSPSFTHNDPENVFSKETEYTNILSVDEQSATNLCSADIPRSIEITGGLPEPRKLGLTEHFRKTLEKTILMKQSLRNAVYKEILLLQPDSEVGIPYCQCTDNTNGESQEAIEYIVNDRKGDFQENTNLDKKLNGRKMENNGNAYETDSEERETFNEESKFGEKRNEREIEEAGSSCESRSSVLKSGTEESGILGKQSGPNCNMLVDGKILEIYNIIQTVVSTSALNLGEEVGNAVENGIHLVSSTNEDEIVSCEGKNDSQSIIDNYEEDNSEKESANTESIRAIGGLVTRNDKCHTPVSEIIPDQSEIRNIGFVSPKAYVDSNQSVGLTEMEKPTEMGEMKEAIGQ